MANKNENWDVKEFKKCPACGSKRRFAERLGKEAKKLQRIPEGVIVPLQCVGKRIIEKQLEAAVPVGGRIRAMRVFLDVCESCGCYYAVQIEQSWATKRFELMRPPGVV